MDLQAAPSNTDTSESDTDTSDRGETPWPWHEDPWLGRVARWSDAEADAAIREGLSIGLAAHLQKLLNLTDEEAAQLIGRSRSTYARYRNAGRDLGMAESDVDLLVTFSETPDLPEFVNLKRHLEEVLGREVDLGMPGALKEGPAADNIRREVQYL